MSRGEGFLTQISVGVVLFIMAMTLTFSLMVGFGEDYSRTISQDDEFTALSADMMALQIESQDIQKSSGIDAKSSDIAQLQGVLSAGENQANTQTILTKIISEIQSIIPFDSYIVKGLGLILAILFLAAIISFIRGVQI